MDEDQRLSLEKGLVRLSGVQSQPVEWLWPHYVPVGKLTILEGDPGTGKSMISLALAAALTTGAAMPDGSRPAAAEPASVLLWCGEDDPGDTILPRSRAAGADTRQIVFQQVRMENDGTDIPHDLTQLEMIGESLDEIAARLFIVDPLMAYLPPKVNPNSDAEIRRVLTPLAEYAGMHGAAIILVRHLRKAGGSALYAGGGSIGFTAAARSVLLAGKTRDGKRVLAQSKSSLGPLAPSLVYEIEPVTLEGGITTSRIRWLGPVDVTADDLMLANVPMQRDTPRRDAQAFLQDFLADGPRLANDVTAAAKALGISERTLQRAKGELGVVSDRRGFGRDSVVYWILTSPLPDSF